jgi:predicted N-acyltransferase
MPLQLQCVSTLTAVDSTAWNALAGDSPFLKHQFLTALEHSGCVGPGTAWRPTYLLATDEQGLVGARRFHAMNSQKVGPNGTVVKNDTPGPSLPVW